MSIEVLVSPPPIAAKGIEAIISQAIQAIASDYEWANGQISVAIVDDPTIHQVNQDYLSHDYPTDVISFDLTDQDEYLEGEIIVSWDTAARVAQENGWDPKQELLLYVIHGMLHIMGLDDHAPEDITRMRSEEKHYLEQITGNSDNCK